MNIILKSTAVFYFDKAPSKKEVHRSKNKTELSCRLNQQHTQYNIFLKLKEGRLIFLVVSMWSMKQH